MSDYQIHLNNSVVHITETQTPNTYIVNGKEIKLDALSSGDYLLHIIHNFNSYRILKEGENSEDKTYKLRINGKRSEVTIKTSKDMIMEKMGLNNLSGSKILEVKAPMPGLVLKLIVNVGTEVKKGENLMVLEAMKMENMIKAPCDGIVDEIFIKPGQAVDKNQLMLRFK